MATITIQLQGVTPTTIGATDKLQFAGPAGFDDKINVGEFNDSSHVKSAANADVSAANTPNNVKFVSQAGGTGGDSQADWGDGTEDLDQITDGECTLKINFADASSVITENAVLYAYDGADTEEVPVGVTFHAAEQGDANWTNAEGSAAALALADQGAGTSHDFFIAVSASPESVGLKSSFAIRFEVTYS